MSDDVVDCDFLASMQKMYDQQWTNEKDWLFHTTFVSSFQRQSNVNEVVRNISDARDAMKYVPRPS